jgi:hypothetical protein
LTGLAFAATAIEVTGAVAQTAAHATTEQTAATAGLPVIELFTSQGCSSCPAADALFEHYAKRRDIVALSYSVDYWDYLGWKDTLAQPRFSERQRAYAKARGDGMVYTPQVVIGGQMHVNGARKTEIGAALEKAARTAATDTALVKASVDQGDAVIEIGAASSPPAKGATVWLIAVSRSVTIAVTRGENVGKSLTYFNVVRDLMPLGMWTGKAMNVRLDHQSFVRPGADAYAVIMQTGHAGAVISAAWLPGKFAAETAKPTASSMRAN